MAGQLTLEIVTPERLVLQAKADEVIVPAYDGARGILPEHEPLVTSLRMGELTYHASGRWHSLVVGGGLLEVRDNIVNVLVEMARKPEEIDAANAEATKRTATAKLQKVDDTVDYQKVQSEVEHAEVLLEVSGKRG